MRKYKINYYIGKVKYTTSIVAKTEQEAVRKLKIVEKGKKIELGTILVNIA